MTPEPTLPPVTRVLVVDDDRRVRELLQVTLTTHGFALITAADGEEALLRARRERPDIVLLDVRLPRRSGLEVCELLRNDPTDPAVPIVLVTGATETEYRLQGFARGADDVMTKPFSPKELVARMRRLLARATETRTSARRARELERELASARREVRRADDDARREESLLATASGPGCELLAQLERDPLLARLLMLVQLRLRARTLVALVAAPVPGTLRTHAVRGDRFEPHAAVALPGDGALAELLAGLARPVLRTELEVYPGIGREIAPLVAGRWDLVLPFVSSAGVEGAVLAADIDTDAARATWDELRVVGTFAGVALRNAREVRAQARWLLAAAADRAYVGAEARSARVEARRLVDRAAHVLTLAPGDRERVRDALEIADWARTDDGRRGLDALCASDASGLARGARALLEAALAPAADDRAALLYAAADAWRAARARGVDAAHALERACAKAAADPAVVDALTTAARALAAGLPAERAAA